MTTQDAYLVFQPIERQPLVPPEQAPYSTPVEIETTGDWNEYIALYMNPHGLESEIFLSLAEVRALMKHLDVWLSSRSVEVSP